MPSESESEVDKKQKFSLSTTSFLKWRRPELFSDSVLVSKSPLTRELLEYHLDTLTNRRQEYDFENFCRLIAQKEICPDIVPQTGPLGGGDSQRDGSTYPVADEIAEQWHPYTSRRAASELWAFAFSTKKQWRDKVRGDIAKIAALVPKPVRAYFITSQFVKDKARSELEKELRDKHGIDVHILDRNWLVTRVFENGHEALAIEALDMNIQAKPEKILGLRDAAREAELDELIRQLKEPEQLSSYPRLLVEEYLRAGRLARSLEKPRYEVDGYFGQALRLAEQIGNQQQIIRVLYDQVWTAYWWFEDIDTLLRIYPRVEKLVFESGYAEDSELLHNLWCLLHGAYKHQHSPIEECLATDAGQKVRSHLCKLATDDTRPNNVQYAKTIRLVHDLVSNGPNNEQLPQVLRDLKTCLESSGNLPFFPVLAFVNLITELGAVLGGLPEYDALFETVCSIAGKRDGEVRQGEMLYMRGIQQLQAERGNEALVTLGRARTKLAKAESLDVHVRATAACGPAYENLGLLWAARMDMLVAFELLMREYRTTGVLLSMTIHIASKMYWLELQLSRIAPCLAWYEVLQILRRVTGIHTKLRSKP